MNHTKNEVEIAVPMNSVDDDRWGDTKEASRISGLSTSFFEKKIWRGDPDRPPSTKVGKKRLYHIGKLKQWLIEHESR